MIVFRDSTARQPPLVSDACLEQGVMLRTIVNKLIISPPLTFTREHVDEATGVLDRALTRNPYAG